jgi:hypothetical protein
MLTLVLATATVMQAPQPGSVPPPRQFAPTNNRQASRDVPIRAETPETAVRMFVIAMLSRDEKTLRAVTLPTPDFAVLMAGQTPTPEQLSTMKAEFSKVPLKTVKPGERISLPGRRPMAVSNDDVTGDRAMVLLPPEPSVPLKLKKIDGGWCVDAAPVIAGRKASDAARRKKAAAKTSR